MVESGEGGREGFLRIDHGGVAGLVMEGDCRRGEGGRGEEEEYR